jgi:23S rRNA (cytidine1920-2'-O)/16S rRNA (cytidine1409-2'-O)-methyltransferase
LSVHLLIYASLLHPSSRLSMPKKSRLDQLLVGRGLFASREQARRAILAGDIRIGTRTAAKPSELLDEGTAIAVKPARQYVGRGALKLEPALDHFHVDVQGKTALDIGASTGGFTDCLLQRGAQKVYAVDVGYGQLDWKLRNNPHIIVLEKLNARFLTREHVPELVDICVIDVSFISLTLILPNAVALMKPDGVILALIKPQFELQRSEVGKGGIVRDPDLHRKAQDKIVAFMNDSGHVVADIVPAAIKGADGNQEFFACIRKRSG